MQPDYHSILGVRLGATELEIRRAYRALAKTHHPDAGGSVEKMAQINAAFAEALASIERPPLLGLDLPTLNLPHITEREPSTIDRLGKIIRDFVNDPRVWQAAAAILEALKEEEEEKARRRRMAL